MLIIFRLILISTVYVDVHAAKGHIRWPAVLLKMPAMYSWLINGGESGTIVQYIIQPVFSGWRIEASGYVDLK